MIRMIIDFRAAPAARGTTQHPISPAAIQSGGSESTRITRKCGSSSFSFSRASRVPSDEGAQPTAAVATASVSRLTAIDPGRPEIIDRFPPALRRPTSNGVAGNSLVRKSGHYSGGPDPHP